MKYFLVFTFLLGSITLIAQKNNSREIDPDKFIQELLRQQDLPSNYEEIFDVLYQYYLTPLDLNKVVRSDLEALYLLSLVEINSFFEYRNKYGMLLSVYELQAINGWDLALIRRILPFVEVNDHFDKKKFVQRVIHNPNHFIIFRTDYVPNIRKGYKKNEYGDTQYEGSPYKHLLRYRNGISRDFSAGVTMEKDAGEKIFWNTSEKQYFADYLSFHACLFNKGKWKTIGIGDYKLQFGQGLIFGGGFYMGKSAETILSVKRNSRGILPYSSVLETDFFRGVYATYSVAKYLDLTGFYSGNARDANLQYDSLEHRTITISLNDYGMHRTWEEKQNKRNLRETAGGGNISFHTRDEKFHTGISFVHTVFSKPLQETDRIYNRFDFSGNKNSVISLDYGGVVQNFNFFGEGAVSSSGGKALVGGVIVSLSHKVDVSFLYRNYEKNFHSFYANAFAENSTPANERGYYWGIRFKPTGKWLCTAYYDYFIFPWLKYFKDSPTEGYGYLVKIQHNPSKKIVLYYQLRYEEVGKNQSENFTAIDFTVPSKKYNSMIHLDYRVDKITLRSRVQWSSYRQSNSPTKGFAVAQDILFDFRRIKVSARYCLFDTDDYDNRQYVYEKDVLYAISFPALNGRGSRAYLILQLKSGKQTDLWLRYSMTHYPGQSAIGSGWDEIEGDTLREIKFQIRYSFK